jgi:hypothetical protein
MKTMKGAVSLNWTIGVLLGVVFFASLIGTIADSVAAGQANGNVTGASSTVLGLTTLVVVIVFMAKIAGR